MNPYTPEQYDNMATNVRDCAWPADVKEYMVLIEPMLREAGATLRQQAERGDRAVSDEVTRVAQHMALAIEYIEKQYPNARQLDRGPIMRNLRRWRDKLLAVAPLLRIAPAEQGGRVDEVSFSTVEKVVKALSRIGHTFPESQEEQAARFESLVLDLCRSVQSHFDGLTAIAQNTQGEAVASLRIFAAASEGVPSYVLGRLPAMDRLPEGEYSLYLHAERARVPAGWVLVPREPTDAMLDAMHDRIRILCDPAKKSADIQNDREVWSVMLAAAPSQPEDAGEVES